MSHRNLLGKSLIGAAATILTALNFSSAFAAPYALKDEPLFLSEQPPPLNMLVMSRDHRMYYEAYNDASDLDGDGKIDSTYITNPAFRYFGYFSSSLCYSYSGSQFVPVGSTADKTCAGGPGGQWSGDWLNYVTTSRVDALRKVLYGGLRSTDTSTATVLQRAFIPQDAHSWGKEYGDEQRLVYDITKYAGVGMPTPGTHHLFANTTPSSSPLVTGNSNPAINGVGLPLLRVLQNRNNRIWDWVSAERLVANNEIHSGASQGGVTPTDMVVRVQVCVGATPPADQQCKVYGSGRAKPTGLLQEYGENDRMLFGLISGSYGNPHEGGVLRKAIASLRNEIDLSTGVFYQNLSPPGIINTIDRFRITTFNYDQYACGWITDSSDSAGRCSMWGNPTAEMMYEAVRYFGGKGNASPAFRQSSTSEESGIGLGTASWDSTTDPYKRYPHCSKPYETVISDINPSFDSNNVPGSTMSGAHTVDDMSTPVNASALGQFIWNQEGMQSGPYFIGESAGVYDGAPTVKNVSSFGNIRGLAPEGPTKEGSYMAGSVAYYARINDLNAAAGDQKLKTFAVALASPLPRIDIPVGTGRVTFVPFAKSVGGLGINPARGSYQPTNQIVDFYVDTLTPTYGKFRVNFEDVEQGADHDMDAIAIYEYRVNGNQVVMTVTGEYAAGSIIQHIGYVISGTSADGTYLVIRDVDTPANGDVDYFLDTPPNQPPGGVWNDGQPLPTGLSNPSIRTFTVGTAAGAGYLKDPLWYAAKWGGFDESDPATADNLPDRPEKWDADHDGVPDAYFLVTNAGTLKDQLGKAFAAVDRDAGSASSAAVSSGSIADDTKVYQATFQARYWSGHLFASPISNGDSNHDGVINALDVPEGTLMAQLWDAAEQIPAPGSRRIVTPTSTRTSVGGTSLYRAAVPFQWASLDATLQGQLVVSPEGTNANAQSRLAWLRGDTSQELPNGIFRTRGTFTTRPNVKNVLGDIVDSSPVFVGAPRARYRDSLETQSYSAFRNANANRAPTLYVGANDGMLHAFDADTGAERFAFIPRSVFSNLAALTNPNYTHRFTVDGTPSVTDAFFGNQWHTVLAAGLNKGGQGVYALDVTDPASLSTEANVAGSFLWEFTDEADADLGYTYSRPTIARLHTGKWVAIFGNGYNNTDTRGGADTRVSSTGNAVLYIVDLQTGALIRKLDTGVGTSADPAGASHPNGLSTPAVADLDGDSVADYVFAGDLFGNLWKFDIRSTNPSDWDQPANMTVLFRATNGTTAQPITEKPQVDVGPKGLGMIVLFGTGKFLEASDRDVSQSTTQSFYGIYDSNVANAPTVLRSDLVAQTILGETTSVFNGTAVPTRITSNNPVTVGKKGWYIDLGTTAGSHGEMQVTDPVLRNGRILFTTLIPDTDPCAYGGRSWLMALDEYSGSRLSYSPFDLNKDKSFNASDYVSVNGSSYPASGVSSDSILWRPALVAGQSSDFAILNDSSGQTTVPPFNPGPGAIGRQSWRQLR